MGLPVCAQGVGFHGSCRLHATKYSPYSFVCFRVFIMIKIGQTHVFLKDYVHIHQMGSHFVGGYRLDFSPTEQESKKRPFCKLLALGSARLL